MTNIRAIPLKSEGDENVRAGNYRAATRYYSEAVRVDPSYLQAWNSLLHCYVQLGEPEEADRIRKQIDELLRDEDLEEARIRTGEIPFRDNPRMQIALQPVTRELYYAGAWDRWGAYLIDTLVVVVPVLLPFLVLSLFFPDQPGLFLSFVPVFFIVYWLYFAILESGSNKATIGKRILRVFVTDDLGYRLALPRSLVRSLLKVVLTLTPFSLLTLVNGMVIGSTPHSMGLHDYIAKTLVLTEKKTEKRAFLSDTSIKPSSRLLVTLVAVIALILFLVAVAAFSAFILEMA